MKRILLISIFILTLFLAVSSVCASENVTNDVNMASDDSVADDLKQQSDVDVENQVLSKDNTDSLNQVVKEKTVGGNSTPQKAKSKSSVSASKVSGYGSFNTKFVVKLKIAGKAASGKKIVINVNHKNYTRQTDAKGQATLNIKLPKGTYNVKFSYSGDENITPSSGSSKIVIYKAKKTHFITDQYLNFRQGSWSIFHVKLVDENSKAVKHKVVTLRIAGKIYKVKTDKYGYAKKYLSLKKGTYLIGCWLTKTAPYLSSCKTVKILVRSKMDKGNGYWMWPMHMASTDLKTLAKLGTKHIFLEGDAVSSYGKSYVASWIKKAHRYGIKVHMWILVCYNGDWVSPVRDDGSFKYGFIKQKINEAKYYARIPGVDGIHLDYMRYGGTAHKHINAIKSINFIVKKISYAVHKIKPNAIVSIAIMPEPSMMHYYYGQDVPTLSKYVDALLPMVYKGSYGQNSKWIKSVTQTFAQQSKGAQIWTGLQTYRSESDTSKISYNELMKDARYAMQGGARGVVLFRIGITHYLNFKKV